MDMAAREPSDDQLQAGDVFGTCPDSVEGDDALVCSGSPGPNGVVPAAIPTVLTKLQKWGDYASVGSQVHPTKFVPMKTPLSSEILDSWSLPTKPRHRLTVPELLEQQAAMGRRVGLLLDLSNHDCLYSSDIPPDVKYVHIQFVAKELPPQAFVDEVVRHARSFWSARPDEFIAVHCAYGFNRTGFVVCCYLIEVCGMSVEDALDAFAEARPPGVKHERFRHELHLRYSSFGPAPPCLAGSPDDNSSFGCSPSCRSLELTDLGPSPMSLIRGGLLERPRRWHSSDLGAGRIPGHQPSLSDLTHTMKGLSSGCEAATSTQGTSQQLHQRYVGRRSSASLLASDSPSTASFSGGCNENESIGVNDRYILQTFRQQALAQTTIPEESGSSKCSPSRGTSMVSLTERVNDPGSASSPSGQGQYVRKNVESIDWGAAQEEEASDLRSSRTTVDGMASLKLDG